MRAAAVRSQCRIRHAIPKLALLVAALATPPGTGHTQPLARMASAPSGPQQAPRSTPPVFDRGLPGLPGPRTVPSHPAGTLCMIPGSWCAMAVPGKVQSSCRCPGLSGPVRGKVS